MGLIAYCDLSCRVGAPCPGGKVPWGPSPCLLTEDQALAATPPGADAEADHARKRKEAKTA